MAAVDPLHHSQQPSNVLGKFKLIAELGRGGMSEVYLAVVAGPAGFNKLVVIKLIKAELAEDPDFINMFLEEAQLSARLNHPHIVQTNEVGEVGGRYYIAMEYLEGQPYSRILHRLGRDRGLPLGMSLRILGDVLAGLHYAHELADFDGSALSVVHRDVTPHNVFVTYDGQVKVVDFGIAKAMNSSHETRTGMLKGKVGYMAPEQAKGERVDRRADIFSVGVMLWEAAVGRRLWKGLNEVQILHQLLSGEIPSPRSMRPDISQPLEQLIMKSLASDRDKRHSSAAELQAALDELMDAGSERSTLREVGRLLSTTFEEERKKLKGIIEQQVHKTAMMPTGMYQQMQLPQVDPPPNFTGELRRASFAPSHTGSHIPQVGHPSHPGSHPGSGPSFMSASGLHPTSGSHPGVSHLGIHAGAQYTQHIPPPTPSQPGMTGPQMVAGSYSHSGYSHPGTPPGSLPRLGPGGVDPEHASQPSVSNSLAHISVSRSPNGPLTKPSPELRNKKLTMAALGIAAAAGGLAALLYVGLGRTGTPPASASSTAAAGGTSTASATTAPGPVDTLALVPTTVLSADSPSSSASPAADKLTINVKVEPRTADIFVDGENRGTGKLGIAIPRDGKEHEIKVDANGYNAKTRKVKADETSVDWDIELTPRHGSTGGVQTTRPSKTVEEPPETPPTSGPKRDKNGKIIRDVDRSYPPGG